MQTIKGAFVLALFVLSSCGSVQTINGYNFKKPKQAIDKKEMIYMIGVFGLGWYVMDEYRLDKKWR